MARQGQTSREAGAQSHGPLRAAELPNVVDPPGRHPMGRNGLRARSGKSRSEPPDAPWGKGAERTPRGRRRAHANAFIHMSKRPQKWTTRKRDRLESSATRRKSLRSPLHTLVTTNTQRVRSELENPYEYGGPSGDRERRSRGRRCEVGMQMGTCSFDHHPAYALFGEEGQLRFLFNGETQR